MTTFGCVTGGHPEARAGCVIGVHSEPRDRLDEKKFKSKLTKFGRVIGDHLEAPSVSEAREDTTGATRISRQHAKLARNAKVH